MKLACAPARAGRRVPPTPRGSRAGGRPRDPALDEAIILATRARLVRDGYSRMTLGDIAADAGVSRPTLYRRWNNKFELVADALDYGFRKQRDLYDFDPSRSDPREALVEAVRRLDPAYFNPDAMVLMGNFAGEAIHTPELLEMLRKHAVEPRVTLVENVLSELQADGAVSDDIDSTPSPPCASGATSARLPRRPQGGVPRDGRRRAARAGLPREGRTSEQRRQTRHRGPFAGVGQRRPPRAGRRARSLHVSWPTARRGRRGLPARTRAPLRGPLRRCRRGPDRRGCPRASHNRLR